MKMTGGTIYGNHPAVQAVIAEGGPRAYQLNLPDDQIHIGKYGSMRSLWLKEQKMKYEEDRLILTGHPNRELEYFHIIVTDAVWELFEKMMEKDRANEPESFMENVRWKEGLKAQAEEIVVNEMVYVK